MSPRRMKKVQIPAHTDYTITMVRANGERWEFYTPHVYRTAEEAQRECDRLNSNPKARGVAEVAATPRPASIGYEMRVPFGPHRNGQR